MQSFTDNLNKSLLGEKSIIEQKIACENDDSSWWRFEFSPTFDDNGAISGIIFSGIEITKRKIYEEKIREQHNKLMEISALQSHEIRGPVSTILGLMSLIKADNYEPTRDYLLLLELTTEQLDNNIREIVALAGSDNDLQLFEKIDIN